VTYFLQLFPTSYFSLPSNNANRLWIHEGINPFIGQSLQDLITSQKPNSWQPSPKTWTWGGISYSNYNKFFLKFLSESFIWNFDCLFEIYRLIWESLVVFIISSCLSQKYGIMPSHLFRFG
jgi:hypothetical protein